MKNHEMNCRKSWMLPSGTLWRAWSGAKPPNLHFHVLCPIRPLNPDGKWGFKQRRAYRLDEDGSRIIGEDGKALFDAVPTTDKGDLNRWIKKVNGRLRDLRRKIAALTDWIAATREKLSRPQVPSLASLLSNYYNARNAGAWSNKAKVGNLKYFSQAVNLLTENQLFSLENLEARIAIYDGKLQASKVSMKAISAYEQYKPMRDEMAARLRVKDCVDTVLRQQEQTQQKRRGVER